MYVMGVASKVLTMDQLQHNVSVGKGRVWAWPKLNDGTGGRCVWAEAGH